MDNQQYDVVVVGAGIAGAVLCKVLTNAGKKVLLLEAGLQAGMALNSARPEIGEAGHEIEWFMDEPPFQLVEK